MRRLVGSWYVRDETEYVTREELRVAGDVVQYNGNLLRKEGAAVAVKLGQPQHSGDAFNAKFI